MNLILKKVYSIIAMLCMFLPALAYDFEVNGIYYNIISQSNLEVEVTFNPSKIGKKVDCWDNQWYHNVRNNRTYSGDVEIPFSVNYNNRTYTVTAIGEYAFGSDDSSYSMPHYFPGGNGSSSWDNYGSQVTSVKIPKSVTTIKTGAFRFCNELRDVEFSEGLEKILNNTFLYCPISTISIPTTLQEIGWFAFKGCGLKSVDLSSPSLHTLGRNCFSDCSSLSYAIIGPNITLIYDSFNSCPKLLELFMLPMDKPDLFDFPEGCHSSLEIYVPSATNYGFGMEYISFSNTTYDYIGQPQSIEWQNNLRAYKCQIKESDSYTGVNAGHFTSYLSFTYSNGIDFSVVIPYEYIINKAPMSLVVNDVEREYGDPNPIFRYSISGFVNGENEQTLGNTPTFDCEATNMSKVGNYRILASLNAPNYEITYRYGTLSILKAPLTVTVNDVSKTYGDENPDFTLSFWGLKNGESFPVWDVNPKITTSGNVYSNVGQYAVNASEGVAVNYDITKYNPGTLTITKKNLLVKAKDCERLYNEENPEFEISYIGFVNDDTKEMLITEPKADCIATKSSNVGIYPIVVSGGDAINYNFSYQDGTLKINPLTIGFKDVYNSVTYNDMSVSTEKSYFNYVPEIIGPFNNEDYWIELWFLDGDNRYDQHVFSIQGGDYAGNYVNTNVDRIMWAGKYIFNLISKGTNPNVIANPSRAYLTVNRASNNLEWSDVSPIVLKVGEKVNLGITYQADIWCTFNTEYDEEIINLSSDGEQGHGPQWYITGLKEGDTTLSFGIECKKNDMGFFDFADSKILSKHIQVEAFSGKEEIFDDDSPISVRVREGALCILNKDADAIVRIFSLQGSQLMETSEDVISNISRGMYIITVGEKVFKVAL